MSVCVEKLRQQNSYACSLMVFIQTNNFKEDLPQYHQSKIIQLPVPTNNTLELTEYALKALSLIYKGGYLFKKAGVIITEIVDKEAVQLNMFDSRDREKEDRLMKVVDNLNKGFTRNVLNLAIQGQKKKWNLKRELLSPCYTTKLGDVIKLK